VPKEVGELNEEELARIDLLEVCELRFVREDVI
jgi:hypothetical protein